MYGQILVLRRKWEDSVNSHSISDILKCYEDEAIFKGTISNQFTTRKQDIRQYFENIISKNVSVRFIGTPTVKKIGGTYMDYGNYEFCVDHQTVRAKFCFVYTDSSNPKISSHISFKSL